MSDIATTVAPLTEQPIDKVAVDTIRILAMDAVQAANTGYSGIPMALPHTD